MGPVSRVRIPHRSRRTPPGELGAAAQIRPRRRLGVSDQPRRLRAAGSGGLGVHYASPRSPPSASRSPTTSSQPPLDLRRRRRARRVPGGPLLRDQHRRAADQPRRPRGADLAAPVVGDSPPRRSRSPSRCRSTSSATSSGRSPTDAGLRLGSGRAWQTQGMSDEQPNYDPAALEVERQAAWEERDAFADAEPAEGEVGVYIKPSSPFTSGNLHMGHVRDYAIGDAYARFRRARGDAVLFGFGFDAFGLPAEMAAIEREVRPADWVERCGERMLEQIQRLGFSFDLDRAFYSSDEGQYRWSQWLFLTLLEAGLIYRDDATVDWCDTCQTTLAALQVEDGRCWRCHNQVRLIRRPTWFLRITPYLEENDAQPRAARELGRALAEDPALHPRPHRRGRARPRRPGRRRLTVFTPHSGAVARPRPSSSSRRATPTSSAGPAARASPSSSTSSARAAGSAAPATPRAVPVIDTGASIVGPGRRRAAGARLAAGRRPLRADRGARDPVRGRGRRGARRAGAEQGRRGRWRRGGGAGRAPAPAATAPRTSRSRASATGARRSRSSTARAAESVPVPIEDLPVVLPRDVEPTGEGNPLAERPDFVDVACPTLRRPGQARDRHPRLPLRRALALGPGGGAARGRAGGDVHPPRPAALAALRAARRRQRQRRLRLRPAGRDQGAARHRPVRVHEPTASRSPAASSTRWSSPTAAR